jgi:hypothetical protein
MTFPKQVLDAKSVDPIPRYRYFSGATLAKSEFLEKIQKFQRPFLELPTHPTKPLSKNPIKDNNYFQQKPQFTTLKKSTLINLKSLNILCSRCIAFSLFFDTFNLTSTKTYIFGIFYIIFIQQLFVINAFYISLQLSCRDTFTKFF